MILRSELARISINSGSNLFIEGNLMIPDNPIGIVVFSHGSGSGKNSTRNRLVAKKLNDSNIATMLLDLLSEEEQVFDSQIEKVTSKIPGMVLNKFNISLLTRRLSRATDWVSTNPYTEKLQLGYFASSTGGAAALIATSEYKINSLIIRSGRTDLVENKFLEQIVSPCLFIAGSMEKSVIKISKETMKKMRNCNEKKLSIVEGASHLFEEEGKIEEVADIAGNWFLKYL